MGSWLRNHSISLPLLSLCVVCLLVQGAMGYFYANQQRQYNHQAPVSYPAFLISGNYWETVAENVEGEFISLATYVLLTGLFLEAGARESRKPGQRDRSDTAERELEEREIRAGKAIPWLERQQGAWRWLYEHSLFLAFLALFLIAFGVHCAAGLQYFNEERAARHLSQVSLGVYLRNSLFWLQSLRNWQAGFLSTGLLAVFSIFFRQRGSPVSKGLEQSNAETGGPEEA